MSPRRARYRNYEPARGHPAPRDAGSSAHMYPRARRLVGLGLADDLTGERGDVAAAEEQVPEQVSSGLPSPQLK